MSEMGQRSIGRLIFGIVILAVGIAYTLDTLGFVNASELLRWWPIALLIYGLMRMTGTLTRRSYTAGLIVSVAGVWMLLQEAGYVHRDIWDLWPLLLILAGIAMIRGRSMVWRVGVHRIRRRDGSTVMGAAPEPPKDAASGAEDRPARVHVHGAAAGDTSASTFSVDVIMANAVRKVSTQQLTGGAVVTVMGEANVDLRLARMASDSARLEINVIMGSVNLFVPDGWVVEVHSAPIMGSVEDHSRRPIEPPTGRLVVTGVVMMSSLVITN